ncbi:MAG: hypothetical protein U5O16_25990 [Rhodococcus sp. (in: high G+C Gram-positive bacteria)]|uniref:hypothetical protein n=1 Tax=Rhodococcus sp. TaxID=1831 RepID=UPI002AD64CCE|nr:hypothetical protein [Rhodococcus sp. (in: high G+C Gram-positive bacteria)]
MKRTLLTLFAIAALSTGCGTESEPVAASSTRLSSPNTTQITEKISTSVPATAESTETTNGVAAGDNARTGAGLYAATCISMSEFFSGFRDLAKESGNTYDAATTADEMLDSIKSGELSGQADELEWSQMSPADKSLFEKALKAAAAGQC